jgi:hypothetical protein
VHCRIVLTASALALWVALPSVALAQERKGFWAEFGVGAGSIGISTDEASTEGRDGSGVTTLSAGWAVNPRLLAGVEVDFTTGTLHGRLADGTFDLYNVSGTVTFYPYHSSNFFVFGGAGGAFVDVSVEASGTTLTATVGRGFGFTAGAGYDIYLGRGFSLTPAFDFWYGAPGDVVFVGQTLFSNWKYNAIAATVSIKFN